MMCGLVCGSTCLGSTCQGRKIGGSDTYKFDTSSFEKLVDKLWPAKSDGAQFPCFGHVILTQLLQEVAFFGIIQSGHCTHKTHLRRLEVFALQGHVCQL